RRLDSRQHDPHYGCGAFLSRATSASAGAVGIEPTSSELETAILPLDDAPVRSGYRGGVEPAAPAFTAPCATPVHYRHHQSAEGAGVEPARPCQGSTAFRAVPVAVRVALPLVVPGGLEPPTFPMSRGCPGR